MYIFSALEFIAHTCGNFNKLQLDDDFTMFNKELYMEFLNSCTYTCISTNVQYFACVTPT